MLSSYLWALVLCLGMFCSVLLSRTLQSTNICSHHEQNRHPGCWQDCELPGESLASYTPTSPGLVAFTGISRSFHLWFHMTKELESWTFLLLWEEKRRTKVITIQAMRTYPFLCCRLSFSSSESHWCQHFQMWLLVPGSKCRTAHFCTGFRHLSLAAWSEYFILNTQCCLQC